MRTVLSALIDFCFPPHCTACGEGLADSRLLCPTCQEELDDLQAEPACERCGARVGTGGGCAHCRGKGMSPYEAVHRLTRFSGPMRELIHHAKFGRRWWSAEQLGDRLAQQAGVRSALADCDVIVPVPLHRWRRTRRGYNQAEVVAGRLARSAGVRVVHPLERIRATQPQTALRQPVRRRANVAGAFVLTEPGLVKGKRVVVVDDVMTTGATLREVGRTLLQGEPASLTAIVLAIADHRGRDFERSVVPGTPGARGRA